MEQLETEYQRYLRNGRSFSVLLMDIDLFKNVNDSYGHQAGDEVLKQVSGLLKARIRDCDIVARMGGEEFAILLPDTDMTMAHVLASRLLALLCNLVVSYEKSRISPSASIGISSLGNGDRRLEDLMCRADEAMYQSKAKGRSRVTLAT